MEYLYNLRGNYSTVDLAWGAEHLRFNSPGGGIELRCYPPCGWSRRTTRHLPCTTRTRPLCHFNTAICCSCAVQVEVNVLLDCILPLRTSISVAHFHCILPLHHCNHSGSGWPLLSIVGRSLTTIEGEWRKHYTLWSSRIWMRTRVWLLALVGTIMWHLCECLHWWVFNLILVFGFWFVYSFCFKLGHLHILCLVSHLVILISFYFWIPYLLCYCYGYTLFHAFQVCL